MTLEEDAFELPLLKPNGRDREFSSYNDDIKSKVIYEHLFMNRTHRDMDENILEITHGKTNGRVSANILYYLGIKADHRGIFKDIDLNRGIKILEKSEQDYEITINLLKLYSNTSTTLNDSIENDIIAEEVEEGKIKDGAIKYYYGKRYERNSKNRELAIKIHGLDCKGCGFNFEKEYGEHGKNFIEVHHINPLSTVKEEMEINPEKDLIPLCPNCHRMVHRDSKNVLTLKELKEILQKSD